MKTCLSFAVLTAALCLAQPALAGPARDVCAALASDPFEWAYSHIGQEDDAVDLEGAMTACEAALDDDTRTLQVQGWMARLLYLSEEYEEALSYALAAADADNALGAMIAGEIIMEGYAGDGDITQAFALLDQAHAAGFAPATYSLAYAYEMGEVMAVDYVRAVQLYEEAAAKGVTGAMVMLADLLRAGRGAPEDDKRAFALLMTAAEAGDIAAQNNIGDAYEKGEGVEVNLTEAIVWYTRAVENGEPTGAANLANLYFSGVGVDKNYGEALRWALRAAEAEQGYALFLLGQIFEHGLGVPKDEVLALAYARRSAATGEQLGIDTVERLTGAPLAIGE